MRKSKTITIDGDKRDAGKTFLITEMSAVAAEKWATQAMLALGKAGIEVPDEAVSAGAAAILSAGLMAFRSISFADAEPLLDEMLGCVSIIPDPTKIDPTTGQPVARPIFDGDIEEIGTLLKRRGEVIELHLGFSPAAVLSSLGKAAAMAMASSDTQTSR